MISTAMAPTKRSPVHACSRIEGKICPSTKCSVHIKDWEKQVLKRALYTFIPLEMRQPWDLPFERHCFHQRPKFIPPTRITEEITLKSKGQLTQNGDLAQEFFIHLPLSQRAALLLKEREKGGRTLHKVFLWFLPTAALFFFSPPLPNLEHSQYKQPKANVSP